MGREGGKFLFSFCGFLTLEPYLPSPSPSLPQVIDFENCRFSHESICQFAVAFRSLTHGFSSLSLKNCGLTSKDVGALIKKGFLQNIGLSASLRHLDLSKNKLGEVSGRWEKKGGGLGIFWWFMGS